MAIARITVNGYRGDSAGFALTVNQSGEPADFSTAIVRAEVRNAPDGTLLGEWDVVITGNQLALNLLPKETEHLPDKSVFDVEVDWLGDRSNVQTIAIGVLLTPADVTLPATV